MVRGKILGSNQVLMVGDLEGDCSIRDQEALAVHKLQIPGKAVKADESPDDKRKAVAAGVIVTNRNEHTGSVALLVYEIP